MSGLTINIGGSPRPHRSLYLQRRRIGVSWEAPDGTIEVRLAIRLVNAWMYINGRGARFRRARRI